MDLIVLFSCTPLMFWHIRRIISWNKLSLSSITISGGNKLFDTGKTFEYVLVKPKAPIMTAADDKFCDIFPYFRKKKITRGMLFRMIFHENRLSADDSHKYHALFVFF